MMVTYNRLDLTKETFDCIFENTDYPFELIIVDNASTDGTLDYVYKYCGDKLNNHEHFRSFKVIPNNENKGIAIGRNQALQAAEGDWLSTLDNDVWVPKGWLSQCIDILSKNPRFGMIGVNMENVRYPLVNINGLEFQEKPQGNLGTACTVFPRSLHKMIGYFNWKDYSKKYGIDDSDWGMRVRVAGFRLGYIKEMGRHLGEGERDVGEYREFKTKEHDAYVEIFRNNCALYWQKKKSIYIGFKP